MSSKYEYPAFCASAYRKVLDMDFSQNDMKMFNDIDSAVGILRGMTGDVSGYNNFLNLIRKLTFCNISKREGKLLVILLGYYLGKHRILYFSGKWNNREYVQTVINNENDIRKRDLEYLKRKLVEYFSTQFNKFATELSDDILDALKERHLL